MNPQLLTALIFASFFLSIAFAVCAIVARTAAKEAAEAERDRASWRNLHAETQKESSERFQMYLKEAAQNVYLTAELNRLKSRAADARVAESEAAASTPRPEASVVTCGRSGKRRAKTTRGR